MRRRSASDVSAHRVRRATAPSRREPPSEFSPRREAPSSASERSRGIGHVLDRFARFASLRVEETLRRSDRNPDDATFAPRSHGETLPAAIATVRGCRLAETATSSHRQVDGEDRGDKRHAPAAASWARHRRGPVDVAGPGRIRQRADPLVARRTRPRGIDRLRPSTASPRAGGADPAGPRSKVPCRRAGRRRHDRNIVSQDGLLDAAPARLECRAHSGQEEGDELRQTDAVEDTPFWTDGENGRKVLVAGVGPGS